MHSITQFINFVGGEMSTLEIEGGDIYIQSDIDIDTIKWGIMKNISKSRFRIFVLYPDETIAYEIPTDYIKSGGSYNENYQDGQRRTLSFTLYNYDGRFTPDINTFWAGTRLRFDMGVEMPNNTTYWFKKGIFIINSVNPVLSSTGREVSVEAGDKFSIFENATGKLTSSYEVPIGSDIYTLIHQILVQDTGSGYPYDGKEIIYSDSFRERKTQAKISKNAGDNYGSILLELATQLSAEIFYNANGNLTFLPAADTTLDIDKPFLYNFDTATGDISQLNFNFDYNAIVNKIVVIGQTSEGASFSVEAINNDPGSPLCYQRIGTRVGDIVEDTNIYSKSLGQERADYELRKKLIIQSTTQATVVFNPLLEVNNVITISDEFFELVHERFLIQSISCSLDFSNQMTITFSNLNNLPFALT